MKQIKYKKRSFKKSQDKLMDKVYSDPKYKGKHIIVIKDMIFAERSGDKMVKKFDEVTKKYPNDTPTLTYIPKADLLILPMYGD
jgi:hypothetical protein